MDSKKNSLYRKNNDIRNLNINDIKGPQIKTKKVKNAYYLKYFNYQRF